MTFANGRTHLRFHLDALAAIDPHHANPASTWILIRAEKLLRIMAAVSVLFFGSFFVISLKVSA
jgi:hypothetical protein